MSPYLRSLRRASLRPVLFLLGFLVLVPLLVYNFLTFDFLRVSSFEHRFRSVAAPTGTCLVVDSHEFLRPDAFHTLQTRCGAQHAPKTFKPTSKLRLIHFTDREEFTYLQFAALQSARRVLRPDTMMMHYLETPRGVWYTQCQRHLGLHKVLPPVSFDVMQKAGPPYLNRQQRRQIVEVLLMLRALKKHGGVAFSDFNTFLLRGISVDIQDGLLVASQARGRRNAFNMGLHTMQAPPGHPFVEFLELKIIEMVQQNDPKLHEMTLNEAVGQIVVEKYLEEHEGDSKSSAILSGVAVATSDLLAFDARHGLLTKKVAASLAGKFRAVAAFHVDKYDFEEKTADTVELRELARMQKELTLAGEWQSLDTLLGAVVRLAVTANETVELEPLFS
ncbi:uncharacterized protein PITG_16820 [Phytophthora infestans T30-4]|uniref:Uncharacterized protein n=1 Tax=Phytophthora infestans (strain T30-4) TaxID=403677 RepID=D0NU68_PHYIT|nr:uncharacterized protein PITG_16820 [Phytophthora infestans T30-4]EEY65201.1 conserved hypothetical protein [Phytophthora infestans T30-4]|eukprot:XP_002897265.1 conserved hypothetical protein [Phytophthora infestans T30-4]